MLLLGSSLLGACGLGTARAAVEPPGAPHERLDTARFEFAQPHMGTTVRIVLYAPDRAVAEAAVEGAFRSVERLDSLFSDYRDDSEIAELAREAGGAPRPASDDLWRLLVAATGWADRTDGAFSVTVGPLTGLWRWAMRRGEMPDDARLSQALERSRPNDLVLDETRRTVRLARPGMSLDLGGIAKGYAADVALDSLRRRGLPSALVDAGGDLALGDAPPGADGWRVEFPGGDVHLLSNMGVATSGDRYQFIEIDGVRFSHIIDPRTGVGVPDSPTVVVLARDATSADVLASALSVLDAPAGLRLARVLDGVEARRTAPPNAPSTGDWQTEGFPRPPRRP